MFGIIKTWRDYRHEAESYKVRYDLRVQMYNKMEEELEEIKKENEAMRKIICAVSDEKIKQILKG